MRFLVALLLLWGISGCHASGTGANMHGKITLDGQPVAKGTITVMPVSGQGQAVGGEFANGEYSLRDVPIGKVNIVLHAMKETGETYDDNGTQRKVTVPLIPAAYRGGIEKQIEKGANAIDFPLVSTGTDSNGS